MVTVNQALQGKAHATGRLFELLRLAYRDNLLRKPWLVMLDGVDFDGVSRTPHLKEMWIPLLDELAKLSRKD